MHYIHPWRVAERVLTPALSTRPIPSTGPTSLSPAQTPSSPTPCWSWRPTPPGQSRRPSRSSPSLTSSCRSKILRNVSYLSQLSPESLNIESREYLRVSQEQDKDTVRAVVEPIFSFSPPSTPAVVEQILPVSPPPAVLEPRAPPPPSVSSQYHAQDEFGNHEYGYENVNSAKHEVRDELGVRGSYSWWDEAGHHTVNYVADQHGFRVL